MYYSLLGGGGPTVIVPREPDEEDTVQSLVDKGLVEKVWEYKNPGGEPIYSSPVGPVRVYAGDGDITNQTDAVLIVGWDWYLRALDVNSGMELWSRALDSNCYGRVQAADVNGDGYNEIFAPCHAGFIRSFESDGVPRWTFYNIYDRMGSGWATGGSEWSLIDTGKNWPENAFMRSFDNYGINAYVRFLNGANAFVPGTEDERGIAPTDRFISQNNEGNTLWVSEAWPNPVAAGDQYVIIPRYPSDRIFMHAGTLVNDGGVWYLYVTGFDNSITKLNANTGAVVWTRFTQENIEPYPLVWNGVYAVSIDGRTRRLDAATGNLYWECETGQCDAFINAMSDWPNKLYVSSRDNRVYKVDGAGGNREHQSTDTSAWDYGDIDSSALPVSMPMGDLRVVVGGDSGTVYCFDQFLETQWAQPAAPTAINSSPVVHNVEGKSNELAVLIGDMRGTIHCYDMRTGKSIGKLYHKGGIEGWPYYGDIDGDGNVELIVTTTDGYVVCWRFLKGTLFNHSDTVPGRSRWAGKQNTAGS